MNIRSLSLGSLFKPKEQPPVELERDDIGRHARFMKLTDGFSALPAAPRFSFGDFSAGLAREFYGRSGVGAAGVFTASDIEISDGFILRSGGKLLLAPSLNWNQHHLDRALERHGLPASRVPARRLAGKSALICTPGYPIYGHWLADILPKLALLEEAGFDLDTLNFIIAGDTPAFGRELLRLAGIAENQLITLDNHKGSLRPEMILLPTFPHNGRQFVPLMAQSVACLRKRFESRFGRMDSGSYPERLLISRASRRARSMANREGFEALAVEFGFSRVLPETLPLIEQVRLFAGAREIVGEYGSALHSSIFSPAGTMLCALRGTRLHPAFIQSGIGDALAQPTGYVFGRHANSASPDDFEIDLDDLRACFEQVFGVALRLPEPVQPQSNQPDVPAIAVPETPVHARECAVDVKDRLFEEMQTLVQSGDYPGARRAAEALLAVAPQMPGVQRCLWQCATAVGDTNNTALQYLVAAVCEEPGDAGLRVALREMLPQPEVLPTETIDVTNVELVFSAQGNVLPLLREGWSRPEPGHIWAMGESSTMQLPAFAPGFDVACSLIAWTSAKGGADIRHLRVRVNGIAIAQFASMRGVIQVDFMLPAELLHLGNPAVMMFEHPDWVIPNDLGFGNDNRKLAFAMKSMRLRAVR